MPCACGEFVSLFKRAVWKANEKRSKTRERRKLLWVVPSAIKNGASSLIRKSIWLPRATFFSPWKRYRIDFHRNFPLRQPESSALGALSLNLLKLRCLWGGIAFQASENSRTASSNIVVNRKSIKSSALQPGTENWLDFHVKAVTSWRSASWTHSGGKKWVSHAELIANGSFCVHCARSDQKFMVDRYWTWRQASRDWVPHKAGLSS